MTDGRSRLQSDVSWSVMAQLNPLGRLRRSYHLPMSKDELMRIAIAAAVAVIFKDLLSWFIRRSKPVAKMLVRIIGSWIARAAFLIEFVVDVFLFIWWVVLFFIFPDSKGPVTHGTVRIQIGLTLLALMAVSSAWRSFFRWRASRHRPNTY